VTKRELILSVADRLGYTQNEVANIVQATLDGITETLTEGSRLEIRNFGVFEVKTREARVGRNPRTGDEVSISDKRVATFKPGKALKELVQNGPGSASTPARPLEPQSHTESADDSPDSRGGAPPFHM